MLSEAMTIKCLLSSALLYVVYEVCSTVCLGKKGFDRAYFERFVKGLLKRAKNHNHRGGIHHTHSNIYRKY